MVHRDGPPATDAHDLESAARLAGFKPGDVTPYTLRHHYISRRVQMLDRGQPVSVFSVARELGTSVGLIQKTYGHLLAASGERSESLTFRRSEPRPAVRDNSRDTAAAGAGSERGPSVDSAPSWGL